MQFTGQALTQVKKIDQMKKVGWKLSPGKQSKDWAYLRFPTTFLLGQSEYFEGHLMGIVEPCGWDTPTKWPTWGLGVAREWGWTRFAAGGAVMEQNKGSTR